MSGRAQPTGKTARVGMLNPFPRDHPINRPYFEELAALGYNEGRNLTVEFREGSDDALRVPGIVAELVRSNIDVILVEGPGEASLQAALAVTKSIPIVIIAINFDPLETRSHSRETGSAATC